MSAAEDPRPTVLVSSTVYGIEDLLEQIFGILNGFGYEVWIAEGKPRSANDRRSATSPLWNLLDCCARKARAPRLSMSEPTWNHRRSLRTESGHDPDIFGHRWQQSALAIRR
jgi:hypothetical protein